MSKARELASLGNAYSDGALSNRNLIINGACNVQQRVTPTTTHASYGTVDRMRLTCGGGTTTLDAGTVASGTEPYALGFRNTARLTNTVAGSDATADYAAVATFLEAQNVATSGWDYTSTSGKMTLSFWVKSSVAGTYTARFEAYDVVPTTKNYSISFTIPANTWTKVVKTISGDSALQFDMNSYVGLGLYIWAYIGSNYTTSTNPVDTWDDLDGADQTLDHPQNWKAVSGATFEVTGLMLEVGDTATPFEHRSYGQELQACRRFYHAYEITGWERAGSGAGLMGWHNGTDTTYYSIYFFPSEMRAIPTASCSVSGTPLFRLYERGGTSTISLSNGTAGVDARTGQIGKLSSYIKYVTASGYTNGSIGNLSMGGNAGYIRWAWDAEL